uniref:Peptidase A1 domain-containing protein n=1 Tax=Bursaphelenchus xylophilus TaxID=6326 RepID=A0A1I7RMK6_BURXY
MQSLKSSTVPVLSRRQKPLIQVANGFVPDIAIPVVFEDDRKISRDLLIDLTSSSSFVLEKRAFEKSVGRNNTYEPEASKTFKKLSAGNLSYDQPYSNHQAFAHGYWGEDELAISGIQSEGRFLAVNRTVDGQITQRFSGKYAAGVIGFSQKWGVKTLRDGVFRRISKNLCFYTSYNEEAAVTTVSLGAQGKNTKDHIVSAPVQRNMEGLWQVLLTSLKIGNYNLASRNFAILSTLTDKIVVPESVFGSIVRAVKARFDSRLQLYTVDCDLQTQLQIGIQFETITLTTHTFIQSKDGQCILNIRPHKQPTYVLGAAAFVDNGVCLDFFDSIVTFFRPPKLEKLVANCSRRVSITKENVEFENVVLLK